MLKGIDVSEHQGVIDWDSVKSSGIDYAILRVGYGDDVATQDDKQFARNADECTRLGIPFGVYIYSYALTTEQAKSEAEHVLRLIKGYRLEYPVYLDMEDGSQENLTSEELGDIAETFVNIIESAGYWCGIYANLNWWQGKLTDNRFENWTRWIAQYPSQVTDFDKWDGGVYAMWQYCSDGAIAGINGNVDCNVSYVNFKNLINKNKEEEEVKNNVNGVVCYANDAEADLAIKMARKLGYVVAWSGCTVDFSTIDSDNIWGIGGNKGSYTGYLQDDHFISGANRDETLQKFADVMGRI